MLSLRGDLYRREHLMSVMNKLQMTPMVEQIIGQNGFVPITPINSTRIKIDADNGPGGLPFVHGPEEDVNEIHWGNYEQRDIEAPYWRGKFSIGEHALQEMRRPGRAASDASRRGMDLVLDRVEAARYSTDAMMAKTAIDALKGKIELRWENTPDKTLNYNLAPDLIWDLTSISSRPTWSTYATADPIKDIEDMKQVLREFASWEADRIVMGGSVVRHLTQCTSYLDRVNGTESGVDITKAMSMPGGRFLGMEVIVAQGVYSLIDRLAADYTSGTTATLEIGADGPFADITADDSVIFGHSSDTAAANNEVRERAGVASISGKTLTIDAALGKDFKAGDQVVWNRPFVGWNDVFLLPPAMYKDQYLCWGVAQSIHADFRSMRYMYVHRDDIPIPAKYAVMFGVDGCPFYKHKDKHSYIKVA